MSIEEQAQGAGGVILFDGVCRLCERSVQFIIRHDPDAKFLFAPLQSDYARSLMGELESGVEKLRPGDADSFILLAGGEASLRSEAWLRICGELQGWPRWLTVFRIVPRRIRDAVYDFIGRHRYQWFGKRPDCMVPTPDIQRRFRS